MKDLAPVDVGGVRMPRLVYGTAWKEDDTDRLVASALDAGFRGIDTANQRRHYHEAGVGAALRRAWDTGLDRKDVFVQTKFTFRDGQDHRLPYDPAAPIAEQVRQSVASSLEHLGVDMLDSYLRHGPSQSIGLGDDDWEAWHAMEDAQRQGLVRILGVSNVSADQLEELHQGSDLQPKVVQNRCFTRPHADLAVRGFCKEHGLAYQGFSLLTGHRTLLRHPEVLAIASGQEATVPQVVFRYCVERGMVVLTGTTSPRHMKEDLDCGKVRLSKADLAAIDHVLDPSAV